MDRLILLGLDSVIPKFADKFIKEGLMPNLAKMKANGYWAPVIPTFPAVTPTGWATVGTGSWPSTHGIEFFGLHFQGEPLELEHDGFNPGYCKSEYFWETAKSNGRHIVLFKYPGSWPHHLEGGIQIGGLAGYAGRKSPLDITHSMCFSTEGEKNSIHICAVSAKEWKNLSSRSGSFLQVRLPFEVHRGKTKMYYGLLSKSGNDYDTLHLATSQNYKDVLARVKQGEWTGWIEDKFLVEGKEKKGCFKLKLVQLSPDGKCIKIYVTQNHPVDGYTTPPELSEEMYTQVGPFNEYSAPFELWDGWIDLETQWEIFDSHVRYMRKAVQYLMTKKEWDIFVTQCHILDYAEHVVWGGIDPGHSDYSPKQAKYYWKKLGEAHGMVDDLIGTVLSTAGKDTHIAIMGDHGHELANKIVFMNNLLVQRGLLTIKRIEKGKLLKDSKETGLGDWVKQEQTTCFAVDWTKSKAFAVGAINIFINLKGREPQGIVNPGREYEKLREQIIELLYGLQDKSNGKYPVKGVWKKEQMQPWGLYGGGVGDIIYMMNEGYDGGSAVRLEGEPEEALGVTEKLEIFRPTRLLRTYTSEHPSFSPFNPTMWTLLAMTGPGVKQYERTVPLRLVDVTPTICHITRLPYPPQCEGAVPTEIISMKRINNYETKSNYLSDSSIKRYFLAQEQGDK